MGLSDITREGVNKAATEFDRLGRGAFLTKYGFGEAKSYFLLLDGRPYDSKAIIGAAHGFDCGSPLLANEFSGGVAKVARILKNLGFAMSRPGQLLTPVILVENERTAGGNYDHWKDVTGERYQFPNQYKNRVVEGRPFIYYRGARRANGRRGTPEYFGHGIIGSVDLEEDTDLSTPKAQWKWMCEIADYWPFEAPVPFKKSDEPYEEIAQNQWGVAVRDLSDSAYKAILLEAGIEDLAAPSRSGTAAAGLNLPALDGVCPTEADGVDLLVAKTSRRPNIRGKGQQRRSKFSKAIGDRGEEIVLKYLQATLVASEASTLRWVASAGEKPGWDIEYHSNGRLIAVEVKATSGDRIPSLEITANEWDAARSLGPCYRLALVTRALSGSPTVQLLHNPAALVKSGDLACEPLSWQLERRAES
jgi:hypothetical protein